MTGRGDGVPEPPARPGRRLPDRARRDVSSRPSRPAGRGQTTLDFATGASVFLLAAAFVFAFVPGAFDPYTGPESRPLAADRAASQFAGDLLGDPARPHVLNETCTNEFFAGNELDGCRYDSADPAAAVGLDGRVNVTLERDDAVVLAAGPAPDDATTSVITAQRLVSYDGRTHRLYVRVWNL